MNKVTLMGRLTKDPELRYAGNNNTAISSFTLAVDRRFSKEGDDRQADFIFCKSFGKTAEFVSKYFNKGKQIAIAGRIQTSSYEKDGQRVFSTEVIAEDVYFTGSKRDSEDSGPNNYAPDNTSGSGFTPIDSSDDELPF